MMHTDSTSCKSGNIPEIMKWIYKMFLLYYGRVTEHNVNFEPDGRILERYGIVGHNKNRTITLEVTIDRLTGCMHGYMERSRSSVPVYKIGSSQPVEYLGKIDWKTFGDEELSGLEYRKKGVMDATDEDQ